jgi:hypothetical protein
MYNESMLLPEFLYKESTLLPVSISWTICATLTNLRVGKTRKEDIESNLLYSI